MKEAGNYDSKKGRRKKKERNIKTGPNTEVLELTGKN